MARNRSRRRFGRSARTVVRYRRSRGAKASTLLVLGGAALLLFTDIGKNLFGSKTV